MTIQIKTLYNHENLRRLAPELRHFMRNTLSLLALLGIAVALTGCAGSEEKMGRGMRNTFDIVRLADMRSSVEQAYVWNGPMSGATTGVIKGADRSIERTGLGIVEMITAPFPPYHPIFTKYIPAYPDYPDSFKPGLPDDPLFHTDIYTGYTGGGELNIVPGSTFDVFNH